MESRFNWDEVEIGKEIAPLEYVLSEELVEGFAEAVEERLRNGVLRGSQ